MVLQGHLDMVCEKAPGCTKDMETEGLDLVEENGWVYARGTTLGGDDGIAVAMMLALLDEKDLPAPRLECIITSDEEIGMLGAAVLQPTLVTGRNMINLDSEAEGVFTVSCAGGNPHLLPSAHPAGDRDRPDCYPAHCRAGGRSLWGGN